MANKNGHWYTDKNGNHYFVENGQSPKEGWEASKRRKMISGGKYKVSEDGSNWEDVDEEKYKAFESDESEFDETTDDDFGFDENENDFDPELIDFEDDEILAEIARKRYGNIITADAEKEFIEEAKKREMSAFDVMAAYENATGREIPRDEWHHNYEPTFGEYPEGYGEYLGSDLEPSEDPADYPGYQEDNEDDGGNEDTIDLSNKTEDEKKKMREETFNKFNASLDTALKSKDKKAIKSLEKAIDKAVDNNQLTMGQSLDLRDKINKKFPYRDDYDLGEEVDGGDKPYQSKYKYEDFEDARFYPTESTMDENNRWVGRYHSITDAHGLKGWGDENVKHVGNHNGTDMFQLPDGYYSINPNITSMSFKTVDALKNYLDEKNPEEHKYGVYWDGDIQRSYRGKSDDGKEYDMEGPDAYKKARTQSAKETWPPEDLEQYVSKTDNGYSFNMDMFKDKSLDEIMMLTNHPDFKKNTIIHNAVMRAIYQKLKEQPDITQEGSPRDEFNKKSQPMKKPDNEVVQKVSGKKDYQHKGWYIIDGGNQWYIKDKNSDWTYSGAFSTDKEAEDFIENHEEEIKRARKGKK